MWTRCIKYVCAFWILSDEFGKQQKRDANYAQICALNSTLSRPTFIHALTPNFALLCSALTGKLLHKKAKFLIYLTAVITEIKHLQSTRYNCQICSCHPWSTSTNHIGHLITFCTVIVTISFLLLSREVLLQLYPIVMLFAVKCLEVERISHHLTA